MAICFFQEKKRGRERGEEELDKFGGKETFWPEKIQRKFALCAAKGKDMPRPVSENRKMDMANP